MLKAATVLALVALVAAPARADDAADLIVGSVRDQRGTPVARADIVALDEKGSPAGHDRSDALGTFVVSLDRPARALVVRCNHCRAARLELHGGSENVAIVIERYGALESSVPNAEDLAALPYGAVADALGLIPFTLPSGSSLSDRGLGGGRGFFLDDGAPLVDLSVGVPALLDFPDRYVRTIGVAGPDRAFRYGTNGGGGTFALDQADAGGSSASLDVGQASALAILPAFGTVAPAFGVSSDGGVLARRADLDYAAPFAGGALRADYDLGTQDVTSSGSDLERNVSTLRLSYATASRHYRTFADFSATDVGFASGASGAGGVDYRSGYLSADFRIEDPGPVTLSAGLNVDRQTSDYVESTPYDYQLDGRADDATAYVEARAGDERANIDAGLGLTSVAAAETLPLANPSGTHVVLLPSLTTRVALGGGAYVRAGYSESSRLPTLLEMQALLAPPAAPPLERAELAESAFGFDDGARVRAEAIAYSEFTHAFDERRLDGLGLSLVWQIAPLVSLRAWSLRASPLAFAPSFEPESDASRQVVRATYANGDGLRLDAIVHRDASESARAALAFDADAFVPLVADLALDLGSVERGATRRYYVGLRARR